MTDNDWANKTIEVMIMNYTRHHIQYQIRFMGTEEVICAGFLHKGARISQTFPRYINWTNPLQPFHLQYRFRYLSNWSHKGGWEDWEKHSEISHHPSAIALGRPLC